MKIRRVDLFVVFVLMFSSSVMGQSKLEQIASFEHPGAKASRVTGGRQVALSDNGKTLIAAFFGSKAQLYDLRTQKAITDPIGTSGDGEIGFVSNDVVFTADWESMRLWDVKTGDAIGEPIPHRLREDTIIKPAISSDGKYIATRNSMNSFQLWDAQSQKAIGEARQFESVVGWLTFSADNRMLYVKAGKRLFVFATDSAKQIAGAFESVYRFHPLPEQKKLITIEGENADQLVLRTTEENGWPEIDRVLLAGKFKRIIELDDNRLLIQSTKGDYSPDIIVLPINDLRNESRLEADVDRAFKVLVTGDRDHWICNNIHNVSCQRFGQSSSIWKLNCHCNGYKQGIYLLDDEHVVIHDTNSKNNYVASCHRISDGSKIWEQGSVAKIFVQDQMLFVCNSDGVQVWAVKQDD